MAIELLQQTPNGLPGSAARFFIDGPAGRLETVFEPGEGDRRPCAVICHPHPLHGGSMQNKVVTIVARALRELGWHTLRFNFRGVGESQGSFDDGVGELEDLHSVMAWAQSCQADSVNCLAGFSFGSYIAAQAAQAPGIRQLISIAPPVERCGFAALERPACPWLVVQGDADDVVTPQAVFDWAATVTPAVDLHRMAGAGHFFHRRLMDLRNLLHGALDPA